jgi:hypothetical protein
MLYSVAIMYAFGGTETYVLNWTYIFYGGN